jgi:hypothetical protein
MIIWDLLKILLWTIMTKEGNNQGCCLTLKADVHVVMNYNH